MPLKMIAKGVARASAGEAQPSFAPPAEQERDAARGHQAATGEDSEAAEVKRPKRKGAKGGVKPFQVQLIRVNKKAKQAPAIEGDGAKEQQVAE